MPEVIRIDSVPSTNTELADRAAAAISRAAAMEPFTTLVTLDQTAGKGRSGRTWVAPPGTSLAISVLVPTDRLPADRLGWVPIAAGVAMTETVAELLPGHVESPSPPTVSMKWPNDVLIGERKVCGVLAELTGTAAIVGAGLNLSMTAEQLPVPTATSLVIAGADPDGLAERALQAYLDRVIALFLRLAEHGGDAEASGLADAARRLSSTIGREVRVELPGDAELVGTATAIDSAGRIVVAGTPLSAGDVVHLRPVR